jgi:hypothetical protein
MKKELRQTTPNPSSNYPTQNAYSSQQNYHLGAQKTNDIVNESRIDRQLPGFSNNVNVSQMSFNHGFGNPSGQRSPHGYNPPSNTLPSRSMPNNSFYNDNPYGNTQGNRRDMEVKNSFNNHGMQNPSGQNNFNRASGQNQLRTSPNVGMNPSGYGNSFGMGNPPGYHQNNTKSPVDVRASNQMGGPSPSNPGMNRAPGQQSMEEIEKGQLEQFSKFLMAKKNDIEAKLRTMPKVCRRVADKREKLQLNKDLDEVSNELDYVQGLLRGP